MSTVFTSALYQGSWLPCRVLEEDSTRTLLVRVVDRNGTHEVWLRPEHVRGHVAGSGPESSRPHDASGTSTGAA